MVQTVFRGLLSLIFLVAGAQHLLQPNHIAHRLSQTSWADLLAADLWEAIRLQSLGYVSVEL